MALPPDLQYLRPLLDVLVELVLEDLQAGNSPCPEEERSPTEGDSGGAQLKDFSNGNTTPEEPEARQPNPW